jgi:hypothetical protein
MYDKTGRFSQVFFSAGGFLFSFIAFFPCSSRCAVTDTYWIINGQHSYSASQVVRVNSMKASRAIPPYPGLRLINKVVITPPGECTARHKD